MRKTIRLHRLVEPGQRVVVAVSGGADSVALLLALRGAAARLRIDVEGAHFHHGLRGADADADAAFVRELCDRLEIPLHLGRPERPIRGPGLEAAARRARYAFLAGAAERCSAVRIATAHTADDQAETVLMRLLRGSGADGLKGIRLRRGRIIRPLLECPRADVLDFLAASDEPFREDASNADRRFLRNRVRHEVLPVLAAINPRVRAALARTAAVAQAEANYLERAARHALAGAGTVDEEGLSVAALRHLPEPLQARVVRRWLAGAGCAHLSYERLRTVLAVAQTAAGTRATGLPGGARVERVGGRLVVRLDPRRQPKPGA